MPTTQLQLWIACYLIIIYYHLSQADDELDPEDVEFDEHYTETRSKSSAHTGDHMVDEYPDISGITTARVRHKNDYKLANIKEQGQSF